MEDKCNCVNVTSAGEHATQVFIFDMVKQEWMVDNQSGSVIGGNRPYYTENLITKEQLDEIIKNLKIEVGDSDSIDNILKLIQEKQDQLIAGENIEITEDSTISAKDTEYEAMSIDELERLF